MTLAEDDWVIIPRAQTRVIEEPQVKVGHEHPEVKLMFRTIVRILPHTNTCRRRGGAGIRRTMCCNSHGIDLYSKVAITETTEK